MTQAITRARSELWLAENQEAIESSNAYVEKHGLPLAKYRMYGGEPRDFKPMPSVGSGAYEIRYRDDNGAFRVIYVAKLADAVYVLHAFQKKAQKTSKSDIDLAANRYKRLVGALK